MKWLTVPDIVADADRTLDKFDEWMPRLENLPLALAGQDGMEQKELPWDNIDCLFIGGSTYWKLSKAAADLASEAKHRGKWLHMGRVNSDRRLRYAYDLGCDSVDGTGYSQFSKLHLKKALHFMHGLHQQLTFFKRRF